MFTFTDLFDRSWELSLTVATARRVERSDFSEVGVKDLSLINPDRSLFKNVMSNSKFMLALVWAIVQPQAERGYRSFTKFLNSLDWSPPPSDGSPLKPTFRDAFPDSASVLSFICLHGYEEFVSEWTEYSGPSLPKGIFPVDPTACPMEAELEFVSGFSGGTINSCRESLWGALGDFFPDQATVLSKLAEQEKKVSRRMVEEVSGLMPQVDEMVEEEIRGTVTEAISQMRKELASGKQAREAS